MYGSVEESTLQRGADALPDEKETFVVEKTGHTHVGSDANNKRPLWPLLTAACALIVVVLLVVVEIGLTSSAPSTRGITLQEPQSANNLPFLALSQNNSRPGSPPISRRGGKFHVIRDDVPYFYKAAMDPYHPLDNPNGYLVMGVAENKLMWKEMAEKIQQAQAANDIPEWAFGYGDMGGELKFKLAMGNMMQRWINDAPIDAEKYLFFQAGAGSVLSQISVVLADNSDGLLITAPGYMPLMFDFGTYGHTETHLVQTHSQHRYIPQNDELEDAYQRSVEAGNPPRILVLIQPNNPTGTVYPKKDMERMIEWALEKGLHVVSDEIYALSAFPGVEPTSAATVMYERFKEQRGFVEKDARYMGDYVHIVAGLSKDWGMSGFRVGSLFTHNVKLLEALEEGPAYYQSVSQYTQNALTPVFEDDEWIDWYIEENQRRIYEAYQTLERVLALVDVPLYPADGAIFAWADFSAYIAPNGTEHELWLDLFDSIKVLFTNGESCAGDKPGMMRIVYTWPEAGTVAVEELGKRLVAWQEKRR